MKRKQGNYLQLSRKLFNDEKYSQLSLTARWLYVVLNELEHKYTGSKEDFFWRSNEDLAQDCGVSLPTLKRAKKELLETDLIQVWQMHWMDKKTGKKSEKKVTAYRIRD